MADDPARYRQFAAGNINRVRGGLNTRSSLFNIDNVNAVRNATTDTYRTGQIPKSGPFRAQVIKGYPKEMGPPPGYESDVALQDPNTGTVLRVPWCVVRVYGAHENILDPARFDPIGSKDQQRGYYAAAVMHQNVGICLPDMLSPDYPVPQPGDMVQVTFTDARTYSGGRYKVENPVAPAATGMLSGFTGEIQRRLDMAFPGTFSNEPLQVIDFAAATCDNISNSSVPIPQRRPQNLTFGTVRGYNPPAEHLGNPNLVPSSGQYPVAEFQSRTPNEFLQGSVDGREFRGSIRPGFGRNRRGRIHKGEDIYIPPRAIVYAPFGGEVIRSIGESGCTDSGCDYGKVITIRSADDPNLIIRIIHIKEVQVSRGSILKAGDILGVSYYANPARPNGRRYIEENRFPGGDPSHIHLEAQFRDRPRTSYKGNVNPYVVFDVSLMYWPECSVVPNVA